MGNEKREKCENGLFSKKTTNYLKIRKKRRKILQKWSVAGKKKNLGGKVVFLKGFFFETITRMFIKNFVGINYVELSNFF